MRLDLRPQFPAPLRQPTADWMVAYDRTTQALMRGLLDEAEQWAQDAGRGDNR